MSTTIITEAKISKLSKTVGALKHINPIRPNKMVIGIPIGTGFGMLRTKLDKCLRYCDPDYTKKMMISGALSGHPFIGAGLAKVMGGTYRTICICSCREAYYEKRIIILRKRYSVEKKDGLRVEIEKSKLKHKKWKSLKNQKIKKTLDTIKKLKERGDNLQATQLARLLRLSISMSRAGKSND